VASGADGGVIVVRADEPGPLPQETAIVYVPKGTKGLGDKKVFGLATKDNEVLNMPTWTTIVLDDVHVALSPRPRVEAFANAVEGRATGPPAALKGAPLAVPASSIAPAWVIPSAQAAYATLRLEATPTGDLALHVALLAIEGEGDDLAKTFREALRKADGPTG